MATTLKALHLLALGVALGASVHFSFIAAPKLFAQFGRELAGDITGALFPGYFWLVIGCCAVAAATLAIGEPPRRSIRLGLALAGLILGFLGKDVLRPAVQEARQSLHAAKGLPEEPLRRSQFGRLHGVSMVINLAMIGAVAVAFGVAATQE